MFKPIIATNTPSIRNYIENGVNGILVEKENPRKLAVKIALLYNDVNFKNKLPTNLYKYVTENFSQKDYVKTLL